MFKCIEVVVCYTVYVRCEEDAEHALFSPLIQKEVDCELDRLVGQEGTIHTKMLALQRMGYVTSLQSCVVSTCTVCVL